MFLATMCSVSCRVLLSWSRTPPNFSIIEEFSEFFIRVGEVEKSATSNNLMANEMFFELGVDRMTETRCSCVSWKYPRIQKVLEMFLYLKVHFTSNLQRIAYI